MTLWSAIFLVILSPFIGSTLVFVAMRMGQGRDVIGSSSACPHCAAALTVLDLVPIVSWLLTAGRCRHCKIRLTALYPIAETAAVSVPVWIAVADLSLPLIWISVFFGWTLLFISVLDLAGGRRVFEFSLPLIPIGLSAAVWMRPEQLPAQAVMTFAVFAFLWLLNRIWRRVSEHDGLDRGDVWFITAGTAWLGPGATGGVMFGLLAAAVAAVIRRISRGKTPRNVRVSFIPYLAMGIWYGWMVGVAAVA